MIKRSVSLVIAGADGRLLLVQRPPDDEDLPLAWGLPAVSLGERESWEEAVRRAARDKLGTEVEPVRVLRVGALDRTEYRLEMRLYEVRRVSGEPAVPQTVPGVTQYVDWKWGTAEELRPAAARGSLCSRLYLEHRAEGGLMIELDLTAEEARILSETIESYLSDLRMEISGTDSLDFREGLKTRKAALNKALDAIRRQL